MEVTDVGVKVRALLNDVEGQLYTNAVLLPFVNLAYGEAQKELNVNSSGTVKEVTGVITVVAGDTEITIDDIADMILPLELRERAVGETVFVDMDKKMWEENAEQVDILQNWVWRENEIKLLGALTDRQVSVRYIKGLPELLNDTSPIFILSSLEFLSYRTAGLASRFIGGNGGRADALDTMAMMLLPKIVAIEIKNNQGMPVRRRPFGYSRRRA